MESDLSALKIPSKYFFILAVFALINIFLIIFVLSSFVTPLASDSEQYLETAKYFNGQDAQIYPHRLLKPIVPFFAALGSYVFGLKPAFLFINSLLYFFIGFIIFKIIKLLFNNNFQALVGSLLFLTSYPMLEYGIAYMTDLAGWFFFALSVYLTLLFLKKPSAAQAMLIGFIAAFGFLAKESGGMGILFFALCATFLLKDNWAGKLKYLFVAGIFFIAPLSLWQIFIYLKFHYTYYDWYLVGQGSSAVYSKEFFRLFLKSLGATFLLSWFFVAAGLAKYRQLTKENRNILFALLPSSLTFVLWHGASSRLFFIPLFYGTAPLRGFSLLSDSC
ncbi:MAG: glycosyltransferase family 39 protein [Candidatus Portnoybacteria bacterium]|nr:glycosyltransferase family 39 protein [Candidatus Portnoybacteria bacterium]